MKGILFSLVLLLFSGAAFADEYMDPQSKVIYTYEPGSGTAMVKSGFEEVIDDGYELDIVYHPGCPDAFGDVAILDRFTVGNEEYVVKSIGKWAFEENKHIKSVNISETVAEIGDMAFVSCDSLISVQLPEGLTVIANSLFSKCHSLTSVGIPSTVRRIEKYAFSGCSSLTNITIPDGLVYAGIGAFDGTPWYASMYAQAPVGPFYIGPLLLGYKGDKPTGELVIRDGTTCIGFEAFNKCDGLTSIIVPPSVTYVEYEAFYSCTGLNAVHISDLAAWCRIGFQEERNSSSNPLFYAHHLYLNGEEVTDLVIPEGTSSIGNYAFDNCTGLTSVTFSDGVTSIGKNTFRSCSNLSSVTIPSSIAAIGANAFLWCRNLKAVHISDLAAWCGISFYGTANPLYYGAHLYLNEREVTNLTIPEGITSIGDGAFICFGSLTSVKIPNSVTSIGKKTFYRCRGVTSVTIGSMVKTIGESAFFDCDSLSDIYCYAENVPETGDDVFGYNISENISLHVPAASIEAYRTTAPWKDFKYIVSIENSTEDLLHADRWIFRYANEWYQQNDSILCQDLYLWTFLSYEYDEELNGKKYEIVFSEPEVAPNAGVRKSPEEDRLYALFIRRADGRVYADYNDYLAYISQDWENWGRSYADTNYIPYHLTDDGEIILYDYNMEVGDKYRSVEGHDDISVASKDLVTLEDGKPHRLLTLSNGLILIEGIGCINSNGMLLDYLNPASKYASRFTYLEWADNNLTNVVYRNTAFKVEVTKVNNIIKPQISNIHIPIFDLQGRRLNAEPKHGVYIRNGKKVVK